MNYAVHSGQATVGMSDIRGWLLAVVLVLGGCGGAPSSTTPVLLGLVESINDARPAKVFYPNDYAADVTYPLVVMLHGFGANAVLQDLIFKLKDRVTRIVNLAGLSFVDGNDCQAEVPVEVLHIHGTADERVYYESNVTDPSLSNPDVVEDDDRLRAGAFELAERWATLAGCDATPEEFIATHDLSNSIDGPETDTLSWPNCRRGSSTLLRANGVGHLWIDANEEFRQVVVDFALE